MRRRVLAVGAGVAALLLLGASGAPDGVKAGGRPRPPRPVARAAGATAFRLSAATFVLVRGNRVQCAINNVGEHCVDPTNSPTLGGGFWPRGTQDQYLFNSGLQLAAIIPGSDGTDFPWRGDTVGAYIYDPRGDQAHGTGLTYVFNSLDPDDLADWPSAGYVRDTTLFDASLIGRKTASEQDTWLRFWDGNVDLRTGRPHPMGLVVDQRTLVWNDPAANADIVYVVSRLINVSSRSASRYAGLAAYGYSAEGIADLAALGAKFQADIRTAFGVTIPDSGFSWSQLYVGMSQDPDVGRQYGRNYSSAVLPFAMALAWKSDFYEPAWAYPAEIFAPPFAAAPGLVGAKLLRGAAGPVTGSSDVHFFSNTTGGNPFPDRVGVAQLWRALANHVAPQDGSCTVDPLVYGLCALVQTAQDTRFLLSNGPWATVGAGESVVFVMAYVFAAPVAAALGTPGSVYDLPPGIPASGRRLITPVSGGGAGDTVRTIERVAGWLSYSDANADGDVTQDEVRTVPYSLLHKAQLAQAFADHGFVPSSAPPAPRFAVLPGDGQATIVWERSSAEVAGDPFFAVASDPLSPLYDPNFRRDDVEGYRIWRGRSPSEMQLLAQFDYAGTALTDHTGQVFGDEVGGSTPQNCAPELGVTADCDADFLHGGTVDRPLVGAVVQVPPGGRALLASGSAAVLRADTAVTGGRSGMPPLTDTGVRYAYVDEGLLNGQRWYYAVTAFDVNSVNSGASSLESEVVVQGATPRATSINVHQPVLAVSLHLGDGTPIPADAPFPAIHGADGTFAGPIPAANVGSLALVLPVAELLPAGEWTATLDSIAPGAAGGFGGDPNTPVYVTFRGSDTVVQVQGSLANLMSYAALTDSSPFEVEAPLVAYDSARLARIRAEAIADARSVVRFAGLALPYGTTAIGAPVAWGRYGVPGLNNATRFLLHSYWYDEGGAQPPDPTIDPFGSAAHSAGALAGVSVIYAPAAYRQPTGGGGPARAVNAYTRGYFTNPQWYPADFVVTWGAGGAITVRDSTHRSTLPFKKSAQIGWGFLDTASISAATGGDPSTMNDGSSGVTFSTGVISYYSLYSVNRTCRDYWGMPCADLVDHAALQPVDYTGDGVSDGTGFALIVNAEPFFFLADALPAAGTKWHLKAVGGGVLQATCTPELPTGTGGMSYANRPTDCSGYSFTPFSRRPAYAPGFTVKLTVVRQFGPDSTSGDLSRIHTVPDPLYFSHGIAGTKPTLRFVNLPERAVIRIYSASGVLVTILTHNDPLGGGEEVWDVTNRGGRNAASGVYFYHVEGPDGRVRIGRFTIVNQLWP